MATGLLETAVAEAVDKAIRDAVRVHIEPAIARLAAASSELSPVAKPAAVRFVSMNELIERLGGVCRSTILRREFQGKLPPRVTFPDGRQGWRSDVIDTFFASGVPKGEAQTIANMQLASRLGRN